MAGSKDTFKSVVVLDENDIPGSILPRKSCLSAALSTQMTCPGPRIHTNAQSPTRFRSRQFLLYGRALSQCITTSFREQL